MPTGNDSKAEWYLIAIALTADIIGILGIVGFKPSTQVGFIIIGVLVLCGFLVGASTLVNAVKRWLSPRGSYYPAAYHARRIGSSMAALLTAIFLGVLLLTAFGNAEPSEHSQQGKVSPSMSEVPRTRTPLIPTRSP